MRSEPIDRNLERQRADHQHRLRNMAAVIRSVARRTAEHSVDLNDFTARFDGRLGAIVRAHASMARTQAEGVDLSEMIGDALVENAPVAANWFVDGPVVRLSSAVTEMLALVVHELAVEAALSGPLDRDVGRVTADWRVAASPEPRLEFQWIETGVPGRTLSPGFAFVRELLERALPYQFDADTGVDLSATGLVVRISVDPGREP